jgi:hypothetical protein
VASLLGQYVGFIMDQTEDTPHHTGTLIIEPDRIVLEIPLLAPVTDAYDAWFQDDEAMPSELFFRNDKHNFYLTGLRFNYHRSQMTGGFGLGRATVDRVVNMGLSATSFELVNGLHSDLDGLPGWFGGSSISLGFEGVTEGGQIVTIKGTPQPATPIPDIPELTFAPDFEFKSHKGNQQFEMSQAVSLETKYEEPTEWGIHARLHRAIQDLVCIAYWHPCNLVAASAQHQNDPHMTAGGQDRGKAWRPAFTPDFGRRSAGQAPVPLPSNRRPLFRFIDIGAEGVAQWWAEYDQLGKAMWVLSASLFRSGGTVEVRLLQVATALEALGYYLATSSKERNDNFVPTVQRVVDRTDCARDEVLKGRTPEEWAIEFNTAYKGVKHANHALPGGINAYNCAKEGELLARLWLARHLGVSREFLDEKLTQKNYSH